MREPTILTLELSTTAERDGAGSHRFGPVHQSIGGNTWTHLRRAANDATAALRGYYDDRLARSRLVASSVVLCYVGGAAMFWLHAIYRREQGPPIASAWHWLLDSSLGYLALTPVLVLLLPLAYRLTRRCRRAAEPIVLGALFAVVTTPGPMLHNRIAGAGTPLARAATSLFGADPHVAASHVVSVAHSPVTEGLLQLVVGLPVYILLARLVWWAAPGSTRTSIGSAPAHPARSELSEAA